MRRLLIALLALPLIAAAPKGTVALGVGAASSSEVIVKIGGKNVTMKLAGVDNGTYPGQAFLQCLVANRVLRVDRAAGRATLLDGTSVADHVAEFLQTKTTTDPCALGKAAYSPAMPALASAVVVAKPGEANAPAAAAKPKREGHVSFGSSTAMPPINMPASSAQPESQRRPAQPQAAPSNQPTIYRPPTVGTVPVQPGSTYTPPATSTYAPPSQGTTTMPQGQPYTPPQAGTTTIPSTTTSPP